MQARYGRTSQLSRRFSLRVKYVLKSANNKQQAAQLHPLTCAKIRTNSLIRWTIRKTIKALILLVLLVAFGFFAHYQNNNLEVREIPIASGRVGSLSIVHLSDLHGKQFGENNSVLLAQIEALSPDLIVFTGDMIHRADRNYGETIAFMGALTQLAPTVGVFGNHEARSGVRDDFKYRLVEEDVQVLDNEIAVFELAGGRVNVLGFDENIFARRRPAFTEPLFEELEVATGLRIVLSHFPQEYSLANDASFNRFDFDLMFAGHAHGGQWILPEIGGLYAPEQGLFPTYYRGLYGERLIVSPGLGNSYFPLRLFNYPEVIVVNVNLLTD